MSERSSYDPQRRHSLAPAYYISQSFSIPAGMAPLLNPVNSHFFGIDNSEIADDESVSASEVDEDEFYNEDLATPDHYSVEPDDIFLQDERRSSVRRALQAIMQNPGRMQFRGGFAFISYDGSMRFQQLIDDQGMAHYAGRLARDFPFPGTRREIENSLNRMLNRIKPVDYHTLTKHECAICFESYEEYDFVEHSKSFSDCEDDDYDEGDIHAYPAEFPRTYEELLQYSDPPTSVPGPEPHVECKLEALPDHGPVVMPCGHIFGNICIRQWVSSTATCPMCRKPLKRTKPRQPHFS